jgi:hypothetical protein
MHDSGLAAAPRQADAKLFKMIALLVALLVSTGMAIGTPQRADAYYGDYYKIPYSDDLYVDLDYNVRVASFQEWSNDGFPQPILAPTEYVKYVGSASIYASSNLSGEIITKQLVFSEWQKAGFPNPGSGGYVGGTKYHKWDTGPEIFAKTPDGVIHKASYPDWASSGYPSPENRANQGYQKLSWSNSIAYMYAVAAGDGYPISYAEWQKAGMPTPQTVQRLPYDEFCKSPWSSTIYYHGPSEPYLQVTYSQWRAAGFPAPTTC